MISMSKNKKYQKRFTQEMIDRKVNNPELGNFTFAKAVKAWKRSKQFKDLGISETVFKEQYELARMLESYFTEDQWLNVPMHQLEKELIQFVDEKIVTAENYLTKANSLRNFIDFVNDKQIERGYATILMVAHNRCFSRNSFSRKKEESNGNQ